MDGLITKMYWHPCLAYAQLPVHVVTPVLDKQMNKQTNKQTNEQTHKQTKIFLRLDYFQILSEFAVLLTSSMVKILCITTKAVKSFTMVLICQSSSKIRASTFVIRAHPTLQVNKIGWRQAE